MFNHDSAVAVKKIYKKISRCVIHQEAQTIEAFGNHWHLGSHSKCNTHLFNMSSTKSYQYDQQQID